jgi:uncharacterized protein (DUF2236 family)
VRDVLETLVEPARPPVRVLPEGAWRVARIPAARGMKLATVGMLPPTLRERFGLPWGRSKERQLRAICAASRALTPLMPEKLRITGPDYLRMRQGKPDRLTPAPRPRATVAA